MGTLINTGKLALVASCICALAISGCAYMNPMLKSDDKPTTVLCDKCGMPELAKSINALQESAKEAQDKRNWSITSNRALSLATFGFGITAAGYAAHGGHAAGLTNAAIGAGSTYMGLSLFSPPEQQLIYEYGRSALSCAAREAKKTFYDLDRLVGVENNQDQSTVVSISTMENCHGAISLLNKVKLADQQLSDILDTIRESMISEINIQQIQLNPNINAIANAARVVGSIGGYDFASKSGESGFSGYGKCAGDKVDLDKLDQAITDAINHMDSIPEKCVLKTVTHSPMELSQENVQITAAGQVISVRIMNGRTPYKVDTVAVDGLTVRWHYDTIVVTFNGDLPDDGNKEVKVNVYDSSLSPVKKTLAIMVVKKDN